MRIRVRRNLVLRLAIAAAGQHALVEQADADQHGAEADEGQRAQHAFQLRHVEDEHLGHGGDDQRGGGDAHDLRA